MTQIKIYVPKAADHVGDAREHLEHKLGAFFGGWTEYDGRGAWVNKNGETIKEPVRVYEAVTDESAEDIRQLVEGLAVDVREVTGESTVLAVLDGEKIMV